MKFYQMVLVLACVVSSMAHAAAPWTEGKNYFLIAPPVSPAVASGKIEVAEIFSYGCGACSRFVPVTARLRAALPAKAVLVYIPASFNTSKDWPMFQLAFCTAESLGVVEKTHGPMFDAVWKTGELAVVDPVTQHIKSHLPTLEDAAAFYNRQAGVPVDKFLSAAKSPEVISKVRSADDAVRRYHVESTPTMVVNGKYRLNVESAGGTAELIELVKWLVANEP